MISFDEAIALIAERIDPLGTETVDIAAAAGRVLAAPVVAGIDAPIADISAMDGYAIRDADVARDVTLNLIGKAFPGKGFADEVSTGKAVRIFTGAPVPGGADRVVVQEIVERDGDAIRFSELPGKARHIRKRGSDFFSGTTLLDAGTVLTPRALVAAAGSDSGTVDVWRAPRIAIVGTGDELVAPGKAATRPGMIPESVSFGVAALARDWGAKVVDRHHLVDDLGRMQAAAASIAADADLVIVTGGASVGERDYARRMFDPLELDLVFSKVAIKPGKPVWFARLGSKLVLGLPGNPTAAMVTARLFLAPLLVGLTGRSVWDALQWRKLPLAASLEVTGDRETFVRARWEEAGLMPGGNQDSGAQAALANVDWLIRCAVQQPAMDRGQKVSALLL